MKILTGNQIREADSYTIEHEPISSIHLMERASQVFVNWFTEKFDATIPVFIFCGANNNGGDGLAIARLLSGAKRKVTIFYLVSEKYSPDFTINLKRLGKKEKVVEVSKMADIPILPKECIIVEALVGTGLKGSLRGKMAELVSCMNKLEGIKVSVDIAAGLCSEGIANDGEIMKPDYTFSFQFPKLSFFLKENASFVGDFVIGNIGISKAFIDDVKTNFFYSNVESLMLIVKKRARYSHKGTYGKALLICGSYGKMGAAILASRAAVRSGCGLLTTYIPASGYTILQGSAPEAMVQTDKNEHFVTDITVDPNLYDAIGIGPGLGTEGETAAAFERFLKINKHPLVLDADALNILSKNQLLLKLLPSNTILTPHEKEFERLAGAFSNDQKKLELQRSFSIKHNVIMVLKGPFTSISLPDGNLFFNSSGNPGMATGGCGDVLLGIITSLLARGYTPKESALLGCYLHGLAGDIASTEKGEEAMIASDVIECLGKAFKKLV